MRIYLDKNKLLTTDDVPTSYYNLYDGTADFSGDWNCINYYSASSLTSPLGHKALKKSGSWQGLSKSISMTKGQLYTLSCSLYIEKSPNKDTINLYGDNADRSIVIKNNAMLVVSDTQQVMGKWIRIHASFISPISDIMLVRFETESNSALIHWADLMLNKGAVALDWNYSLSDLKSKLGGGN